MFLSTLSINFNPESSIWKTFLCLPQALLPSFPHRQKICIKEKFLIKEISRYFIAHQLYIPVLSMGHFGIAKKICTNHEATKKVPS